MKAIKYIVSTFINEILCYDSDRKKSINQSWIILFTAMFVLVLGILCVFYFSQKATYEKVMSILTIVAHIVVILNTGSYLWSSAKIVTQFKGEDEHDHILLTIFNLVFWGLYSLTLVGSGWVVVGIIKSLSTNSNWIYVSRLNEFVSLAIFAFFFIADLVKHESIKIIEKENSKNAIKTAKEFFIKQIAFIGFPGLIGISIITLISEIYYSIGILDTSATVTNINGTFISGFSSGAVAMHILLTQCIFAVLITGNKQ